jgi:hypothetical protein
VSRQALLACLNDSVMGSTFSRYKTPAFVNLDFHPTFTATLLRKDFDLGLAAARQHEVPMPVASAVHQLVQSLVGHGYGEEDFAALLVLQAQSAGLELTRERERVSDGLQTRVKTTSYRVIYQHRRGPGMRLHRARFLLQASHRPF